MLQLISLAVLFYLLGWKAIPVIIVGLIIIQLLGKFYAPPECYYCMSPNVTKRQSLCPDCTAKGIK